jgi:TPR repeat protein
VIDSAETPYYCKLATDQGLPQAQLHDRSCLLGRLEVEPNIAEAIRYFRSSADNDKDISQLLFAFLLENRIGILPDVIPAVKYRVFHDPLASASLSIGCRI